MLVNAGLLRLAVTMTLVSAKQIKAPKSQGKLKNEVSSAADFIVMSLLAGILKATVFHKKEVEVMEVRFDDVRFPKVRGRDDICEPGWLIKGSTSQLVFQVLSDAELSPEIVHKNNAGSGERTLSNFAIVIPTPTLR